MNTNIIKILYVAIVLIGIESCTFPAYDYLNAYLFKVIDSYPLKRANNDVDSILNKRMIRYYFQLKNDTKQTYWLKLRKYGGNNKDTCSLISFSVNCNNKSINIDPYNQHQSGIYQKKRTEYNYRTDYFRPGDSACIVIDIPEYILDSLDIEKMTPTITITERINFVSHQQLNRYNECKIPHINLINSNHLGKVYNTNKDEILRGQYDIYHDSINNVIYAFPFYWNKPVCNYRIIERKRQIY